MNVPGNEQLERSLDRIPVDPDVWFTVEDVGWREMMSALYAYQDLRDGLQKARFNIVGFMLEHFRNAQSMIARGTNEDRLDLEIRCLIGCVRRAHRQWKARVVYSMPRHTIVEQYKIVMNEYERQPNPWRPERGSTNH